MKTIALAVTPLLTATTAVVLMRSRSAPALPTTVPVAVELFTSEGCSSCLSADATLRELEAAQSVTSMEVIALGQYVDYRNRLGWKDPSSSAQLTERQRWYAQGF